MPHTLTDDDVRWIGPILTNMLRLAGLKGHDLEDHRQDLFIELIKLAQVWSPVYNTPFRAFAMIILRRRSRRMNWGNLCPLSDEIAVHDHGQDKLMISEKVAEIQAACWTERERQVIKLLGQMRMADCARMLGISKQYVGQIVTKIRRRVLEREEACAR